MFNRNKIMAVLGAAILVTAFPFSSMAAETKISSVSLSVDSSIEAGSSDSDVNVTTSSRKYSVEDVTVTNKPSGEWDNGDKPKLKVTLEAGSDYYFASGFSKSDVSISSSDGTVTSVSRSGSYELFVYITLDALDGDGNYDLDVDGLEWDESNGEASWNGNDDANKYEVRLYRNDSSVTSIFTTADTSYDFSGYITKSGDYTFRVRGVYNSSNKGSWEESDTWDVTSGKAEDISANSAPHTASGPGGSTSGAWLKDSIGWWYCNADRSYTVSNWQYINEEWYYFNEKGYMVTGWIYWNSKWYYCGDDGAMYANRTTPDGYYVNGDGAWNGV